MIHCGPIWGTHDLIETIRDVVQAVREQVPVQVERHRRRLVPKHLLNQLHVCPEQQIIRGLSGQMLREPIRDEMNSTARQRVCSEFPYFIKGGPCGPACLLFR